MRQISTFTLGGTFLGLDILLVKEVYRGGVVTPVPDAPKQIRGLMNLRGKVVTVLDLNICLQRKKKKNDHENYLLILKTEREIKNYLKSGLLANIELAEDIAGFLINQMDDVIEVDQEEIMPPPPNFAKIEKDLVEGIIKKDEKLIILLDISRILNRVMKSGEKEIYDE